MIIMEEMIDFVMENMGECFDYCINFMHIDCHLFMDCFLKSKYVKELEKGNAHYCFGMSGVEFGDLLIKEFSLETDPEGKEYSNMYSRSREYWVGYICTYYVFADEKTFEYLFNIVTYDDVANIYNVFHENEESRFTEFVRRKKKNISQPLKQYREKAKLSQRDLSILSGVPIRRIQAYEQRTKDINKCDAFSLYKLALILNVDMEDLLDK